MTNPRYRWVIVAAGGLISYGNSVTDAYLQQVVGKERSDALRKRDSLERTFRGLPVIGGDFVAVTSRTGQPHVPQRAALMPVSPTRTPLNQRFCHAWPETVWLR